MSNVLPKTSLTAAKAKGDSSELAASMDNTTQNQSGGHKANDDETPSGAGEASKVQAPTRGDGSAEANADVSHAHGAGTTGTSSAPYRRS